jgi:hypothetical protein
MEGGRRAYGSDGLSGLEFIDGLLGECSSFVALCSVVGGIVHTLGEIVSIFMIN